MKILLISIVFLTTPFIIKCQSNTMVSFFCDKVGESGPMGGYYTVDELKSCNWIISTFDTTYKVSEFKLTIVPKNNSTKLIEEEIKGNVVPEIFRNPIIYNSKTAFLEFIRATNNKGDCINVNPIAIRFIK